MAENDRKQVPDNWLRAMLQAPNYTDPVHDAARREADLLSWEAGDPVRVTDECRYLDALVHASGDPLAGARVGLGHDPRGGSVLSYILLCCPTLGDLFAAAARYISVTRPLTRIELHDTGTHVTMRLLNRSPRVAHHVQHAEFAIGASLRLMRFGTKTDRIPDRVSFAHPRGSLAADLSQLFNCKVEIEAPINSLTLRRDQLELPLETRDIALRAHLTSYADILLADRQEASPEIRQQIEEAILSNLPRGTVTVDRVAAQIGISSRSLRRRLADENLTFRGLVDELRQMLGSMYLDDPSLSLSEIALLLGFTDQSAFTTAHRRWFGVPPSFRRARNRKQNFSQSPE